MSEYIGTVGQKVSAEVTLINEFEYTNHYYHTTNYTYIMQDAEGNVLIWKTTSTLLFEYVNEKGHHRNDVIRKGDKMMISGKVKEHSEYKGTKQTVLTRCKFSLIAHKPDEVALKREQQIQSLAEGDEIWEMPYKQYKEHYSDCETVSGSFNDHDGKDVSTIKVIIRAGRLKKSGVRGQHYKGFEFTTDDGSKVCYRAISEETARKRMKKEFPSRNTEVWECTKIYNYRDVHRIW